MGFLRSLPGRSASGPSRRTITLTFTPSGAKGTDVRGFVAVDTFRQDTVSGDVVLKLPYAYKVG